MQKRVVHIITGLAKGGAETMLYRVLEHSSCLPEEQCVLSLSKPAFYDSLIEELGISVFTCDIKSNPIKAWRVAVEESRGAEVICCWMYHANLFGYYLAKSVKPSRLIWQVRHSSLDPALNKRTTLLVNRICAKKSPKVSLVTYAGQRSRQVHEAVGYHHDNGLVIANGCDCDEFKPDPVKRLEMRGELGIDENAIVVLSVGRNHPIKDAPNFIRAFARVNAAIPNSLALMCGEGYTEKDESLVSLAASCGLSPGSDILFLGRRDDVPAIMAGSDVYVLHSASEAFPNALIQAMASGLVCISTDVGDARSILGNDDYLVEPCNSKALSDKIISLLDDRSANLSEVGDLNRERVLGNYELCQVVSSFEENVLQITQ